MSEDSPAEGEHCGCIECELIVRLSFAYIKWSLLVNRHLLSESLDCKQCEEGLEILIKMNEEIRVKINAEESERGKRGEGEKKKRNK